MCAAGAFGVTSTIASADSPIFHLSTFRHHRHQPNTLTVSECFVCWFFFRFRILRRLVGPIFLAIDRFVHSLAFVGIVWLFLFHQCVWPTEVGGHGGGDFYDLYLMICEILSDVCFGRLLNSSLLLDVNIDYKS